MLWFMDISLASAALLFLAGAAAGLVGYIAGLASLISYPALLALGLNPLAANATSTLAQVGASAGATLRAGRQVGQAGATRTVEQLVIAAIGGAAGGVLLVTTGERAFEALAPWLILFASLLILAAPLLWRFTSGAGRQTTSRWIVYLLVLIPVCVYGGYFGAGSGVVFLAATLLLSSQEYRQTVLMKTVLLGVSNLTASMVFVFSAPIDWFAVVVMFAGQTVGGTLGPGVQRHVPNNLSRWMIAAGGVFLAWWLWRRG